MSKHNYSQYSNKKKKTTNGNKAVAPETSVEAAHSVTPAVTTAVTPMIETVETVSLPDTVPGVVVGCAKLNMRAKPSTDAEIVCVLDAMSELEIDVSKSNNEWVKVYTAIGTEGYCMRKFVDAHM